MKTHTVVLQDLIAESKDGEWGKGEPFESSVEMIVVRSTDFEDVQAGRVNDVPRRFIPPDIAQRKKMGRGDIIIETAGGGKDRPTGRTQLLRDRFLINSDLPITCASFCRFLRIDSSKAYPQYVYWHLQYLYAAGFMKQFHTQHTGVARFQYTTFATTQQFDIPACEATQRKIASILSAYDDLIENNTRRIAILEEMAQAIYREWFVNFRFPGHENVKLVQSPLGQIPEGWEVRQLDEVCERITSGGTPRTTTEEYWGGEIPWLSSGETGNPFITETIKTITQEGVDNSSTRFVRSGSTVIASAGQGKTRGQTSMMLLDSYINQSVIALTADTNTVTDNFLFFDLARRYREFRQISDGSSRGSLTTKLLAELYIVLPPSRLVNDFDAVAEPIVRKIESNIKKNRNLRTTRDLLLPKLISGQLDVEDLDIDLGMTAEEIDEPTAQTVGRKPAARATTEVDNASTASTTNTSEAIPVDELDVEQVMAEFRQQARRLGTTTRAELLKAVSQELGYKRLGHTIEEALKGHLRAAIRRKIIAADGELVCLHTPSMETYERDELIDAFLSVMRKNLSYEREDVMRALANHLGFRRLTDTVREPIKSAINAAIRRGVLACQGELIWRASGRT